MERSRIDELLSRMNTGPLRRRDAATVALVVFNATDTPAPPCRVRFAAAFPTTAPKPVTVRDDRGNLVPSRVLRETITTADDLPAGKVIWSLVLEFAVTDGMPPRTARTFAASYEASSPLSGLESLPPRDDLPVYETPCHPGDLPTTLPLPPLEAAP